MSARFQGKNVLVTGASRGLGRTLARAFAAEGARVGVGFRNREAAAQETVAAIAEAGGTAEALTLDVRDPASVKAAVDAFGASGGVQVLVNNAAVVEDAAFPMMEVPAWEGVISTNLTGAFLCCRAVAPAMMAAKSGAIVNVVSVAGIRASPGQASYAASKGGLVALTMTLGAEMARWGVRVNAVMPGLLETGMGQRLNHRIREDRKAAIPLGRLGDAHEVAEATLFLASDQASYVVGQVLVVDGGLSL